MKKFYLLFTLIFTTISQIYSQELLKEVSKTFDNGQPMFIDYLEAEQLKKVKTELFNEEGQMVFSIQFNPKTGLPDGKFYDLINEGYFENGVLNCLNCMLVEANTPSVYTYNYNKQNTLITKGDVVDGRLVGEVKRYAISEDTYRKVDWESTRQYVAAGAGIGFRDVKTYRTGNFQLIDLGKRVFNINGVDDGDVEVVYEIGYGYEKERLSGILNVKNGIVKSFRAYDSKNLLRDSLYNENKIWVENYKFKQNDGFLVFKGVDNFKGDFSLKNPSREDNGIKLRDEIFCLGGIHRSYTKNYRYSNESDWVEFDTGGVPSGLDKNGMYTIKQSGILDHIINYRYVPYNKDLTVKEYTRGSNLFYLIYNFIVNNDDKMLNEKVLRRGESQGGLINFIRVLNNEIIDDEQNNYYEKNKQKTYNSKKSNSFNKYLKLKGAYYTMSILPWEKKKTSNYYAYNEITLLDFFDNVISIEDYLKACLESIELGETEIQEIWVWNNVKNEYERVDFYKLIEVEAERVKKAKIERQARISAELEAIAKAEAESERKVKEERKNYIKSLETWYSSEKKSSGKFSKQLKEIKEALIKSMDIDLVEIKIYRISGIDDPKKTYTAYTFDNLIDLDLFKKQAESENMNLFYEDLNKMTLYFYN